MCWCTGYFRRLLWAASFLFLFLRSETSQVSPVNTRCSVQGWNTYTHFAGFAYWRSLFAHEGMFYLLYVGCLGCSLVLCDCSISSRDSDCNGGMVYVALHAIISTPGACIRRIERSRLLADVLLCSGLRYVRVPRNSSAIARIFNPCLIMSKLRGALVSFLLLPLSCLVRSFLCEEPYICSLCIRLQLTELFNIYSSWPLKFPDVFEVWSAS